MVEDAINWDIKKFTVGVQVIDQQHEKLVKMVNQLNTLLKKDISNSAALKDILTELKEYTVYHFKSEEELMEKAGYVELAKHKETHKKFIEKVLSYEKRFLAGEMIGFELIGVLKTWLTMHILGVDKNYSRRLNEAGIK
jgi:hemerythrin